MRIRLAPLVATIVLVVAVAAGVAAPLVTSGRSWYPKQWDARVAPIAATVARLRGLEFRHPVPVRFLPVPEFEKEIAGEPDTTSSVRKAELDRTTGILRALGLLGGDIDLAASIDTARQAGTLALYSFTRKEVLVRGSTIDAAHRVTIAHELTHVLQDQHFDLGTLQKRARDSESGDASAFTALVEGDAVRIERKYLLQLSTPEQHEYQTQERAERQRAGRQSRDVPDVLQFELSAPYEFGPATISMLEKSDGNAAVDRALTGPTPNSRLFIEPAALDPPPLVAVPATPKGGAKLGSPDVFGPFELYLVLAMRLDPARALSAADVVTGGRAVTYKLDGSVCYRVALALRFEHSASFVTKALDEWARPARRATVARDGAQVDFSACDPGKSAPAPAKARFTQAAQLLGIRSGVAVAIAAGGLEFPLARCVAREFVEQPGIADSAIALGDGTPTAEQTAAFQYAAATSRAHCDGDVDAGLP